MVTERKYYSAEYEPTAIIAGTSWASTECDPTTVNTLFAPEEGADINERIGRKVNVNKITLRGNIRVPAQTNATAADDVSLVRLIVVLDRQTNGAQLAGENVISTPPSVNAFMSPLQFQNPNGFGRYQVLKDKYFNINHPPISYDGTNMEIGGSTRYFKITLRFKKPIQVRFNGTAGGAVTSIIDNSFHVLAICTNNELVPYLSYVARTYYTDA